MRSYRREPACRQQPMCQECEYAPKVSRSGDASEIQGENRDVGKSVPLGVDGDDPAVRLASIVVEIDDESVEQIRMNDDESAEEVAANVCRKNDLPDKFIALLAEHIVDRYPTRAADRKNEEVVASKDDAKDANNAKDAKETKDPKDAKERKKSTLEIQSDIKPVKNKKSEIK